MGNIFGDFCLQELFTLKKTTKKMSFMSHIFFGNTISNEGVHSFTALVGRNDTSVHQNILVRYCLLGFLQVEGGSRLVASVGELVEEHQLSHLVKMIG